MGSNKSVPTDQPLTSLPGIGPALAKRLEKLNLSSVGDLLRHYPTRFLDYRQNVLINKLKAKKDCCFIATVSRPARFRSRTGKLIFQITATDQTGSIKLTWFNSPFVANLLTEGQTYLFAGKPNFWGDKLTVVAPQFEVLEEGTHLHTTGLVPIYPQTAKVTSKLFRAKIDFLLRSLTIPEPIPSRIIKAENLFTLKDAYQHLHFPQSLAQQSQADLRLSFNHHLLTNINNLKELEKTPPSPIIKVDHSLHLKLLKQLPFDLTADQQKAISESYLDLDHYEFTHRLIQGETGSGKTMIALFLAAQTLKNKYSFVLLAPTQILAQQHYQTFKDLKAVDHLQLITADSPFKNPTHPTVFIGTHALLNQLPQNLHFPLSTLIVDEQHRFGVSQREALLKRSPTPHLFNLTATPIPRTVALGLFGEINFSFIDTKPAHQMPIKTWVVTPNRFAKSTTWLKNHLKKNEKIFVVCPLIKPYPEKPYLDNVQELTTKYQKILGPNIPVFLLHGQLPSRQIEDTLDRFRKAKSGVLVSTSLIEVGIDIPQAQIIIIHSAQQFGLAQLHQLRGRVGRAGGQGYCFLVVNHDEELETERLKLLTKTHSGLTLARLDLKLRGAGELVGSRQHGFLPVRLKHYWNRDLYQRAKSQAQRLLTQTPQKATKIAQTLASW